MPTPPDVSRPIVGTLRNGTPWETAAQWIATWIRDVRDGIGYSTLPPDWDPLKLARAFIYASGETGVPLMGLLAIGYNESRYNPAAGNSTASGIAGQIPRYAGRFSDANWTGAGNEPLDVDSEWTHERLKTSPYESIRIAARHMANLVRRYGSYDEAFRAYARGGANRNDAEGYAAWGRHVRNWGRVADGIRQARGA